MLPFGIAIYIPYSLTFIYKSVSPTLALFRCCRYLVFHVSVPDTWHNRLDTYSMLDHRQTQLLNYRVCNTSALHYRIDICSMSDHTKTQLLQKHNITDLAHVLCETILKHNCFISHYRNTTSSYYRLDTCCMWDHTKIHSLHVRQQKHNGLILQTTHMLYVYNQI